MIEHNTAIPRERILILDFGSQYTQLIARRIRELNVYAEIVPFHHSIDDIKNEKPSAIILSGGPSSLYEKDAPRVSDEIFKLGVPVLGICYGLYVVVNAFKGQSAGASSREYGRAIINVNKKSELLKGMAKKEQVWMSHGDKVTKIPDGFTVTASSGNAEIAAMENSKSRVYGVQFHPEVYHTTNGIKVLKNFLFRICRLKASWNMESFIDSSVEAIRKEVGSGTVLLGFQAVLIHRLLRCSYRKQLVKSFTVCL